MSTTTKRYRVVDRGANQSSNLTQFSAINPRYWVWDDVEKMKEWLRRAWNSEPPSTTVVFSFALTMLLGLAFVVATLMGASHMPSPDYHDDGWDAKVQDARAYEQALAGEKTVITRAIGSHSCSEVNPGLATTGVIVQSYLEPAIWLYEPVEVIWRQDWAGRMLAIRQWCTK